MEIFFGYILVLQLHAETLKSSRDEWMKICGLLLLACNTFSFVAPVWVEEVASLSFLLVHEVC